MVSKWKRGPPPQVKVDDIERILYGPSVYRPKGKGISKDPRYLMEYRRPAFIMSAFLQNYARSRQGKGPQWGHLMVAGSYGTAVMQTGNALKDLTPDLSNLTTLNQGSGGMGSMLPLLARGLKLGGIKL